MMEHDIPDWVQAIVGILVVAGSLLAFIGALGLVRLCLLYTSDAADE